ncbi:MAG: hypothetical protein KDA86_04460 [Planctomycetaceae bacterium]|nr:hypothetical protein [Planctomycetaceae bacterium]
MAHPRERKVLFCLVATLLVAVALVPFLQAESEEDSPVVPNVERPQKVIVLETGRVILGDVVDRPGGYLVKEQFGSAVIPYEHVRVTAADLPDAYRKLSRMVTNPTAGTHLSLAKWCRKNRLYDSAKFEIKQALLLEPERKDARQFLRELDRELEQGPPGGAGGFGQSTRGPLERASEAAFPGQPWKSRLRSASASFEKQEPESTAGLSPEVVQRFVREVQPLLMNKCGNAKCHGNAATNDFRLTIVRQGSSGFRIFTEQNLSSVLREIDSQQPVRSQLLMRALEDQHGGETKSLFIGPGADRQLENLREWITMCAAEQARAALIKGHPVKQAVEIREAAEQPTGPLQDSFLEEILAEDHPDQFDPEVFNRLMHPEGDPYGNSR